MSFAAFVLVFISVFLHAGWNFLSKKSSPSAAFYLIANGVGALLWLGFACCSGVSFAALTWKFWAFFLSGMVFEMCYFTGLARGYKAGDISLVYPMGRALPVILTALVTMVFSLGAAPSGLALAGMVIVFAGCILMPLKKLRDFSLRVYCNRLLFFILLAAAGTTGYTVFDSLAMAELKKLPAYSDVWRSLFYIFMVEAGITLLLAVQVALSRTERAEFKRLLHHDFQPYAAGVFISLAYGLVLLAMCYVTNVSFVQAFRQMSLPIGVFMGIAILKESCNRPKMLGIVLIVTGLVIVAL